MSLSTPTTEILCDPSSSPDVFTTTLSRSFSNLQQAISMLHDFLLQLLLRKVENRGSFGIVIKEMLTNLSAVRESIDSLESDCSEYTLAPTVLPTEATESSRPPSWKCPVQGMKINICYLQDALDALDKSVLDLVMFKVETMAWGIFVIVMKRIKMRIGYLQVYMSRLRANLRSHNYACEKARGSPAIAMPPTAQSKDKPAVIHPVIGMVLGYDQANQAIRTVEECVDQLLFSNREEGMLGYTQRSTLIHMGELLDRARTCIIDFREDLEKLLSLIEKSK